jgi:hypothetical protein
VNEHFLCDKLMPRRYTLQQFIMSSIAGWKRFLMASCKTIFSDLIHYILVVLFSSNFHPYAQCHLLTFTIYCLPNCTHEHRWNIAHVTWSITHSIYINLPVTRNLLMICINGQTLFSSGKRMGWGRGCRDFLFW